MVEKMKRSNTLTFCLFFTLVLVDVRTIHNQVDLLDREIEACKKFTTEEQEKNEMLTMQLNWSQMEGATSKKLISQKQTKQQELQTSYSMCLRTLRETETRLAVLSKVSRGSRLQF